MSDDLQRICFVLHVRPEAIDEYRARHAAVWPEMQQALRETGWRNYSLFLQNDGTLIGYVECSDFAAAQAAMRLREVNDRWQAEMGSFFVSLEGADPDEAMTPIPQVFHLD